MKHIYMETLGNDPGNQRLRAQDPKEKGKALLYKSATALTSETFVSP